MSTPAGDGLVGDATIRVDADTDRATRALNQFSRDTQGRLRDMRGRFVSASAAARQFGDDIDGSSRRSRPALGRVSQALRSLAGFAASAASQIGTAGGGLGAAFKGAAAAAGVSLLPAMGALVPAAAGAATAVGTLQLAFSGVSEAVALAGTDQEKYAEALKKMGPEQRAFTKSLVDLKKQFGPIGREIQRIALPGFTRAVKAAGPVVKILGDSMKDMADVFGDAADGVTRLLKDSGFQDVLQKNLKLGTGFVRDMTSALGPFTRSLLDFGAASGPTLKAFSDGISGLLGKGLPGMFKGLETGIGGSAKLIDGLFAALNKILPAFGRFAGEVARVTGPVFGELFRILGDVGAGALDTLARGFSAAQPFFNDLVFGLRSIRDIASIIAPTLKDMATGIVGAFLPIGTEAGKAQMPLQRLHTWIKNNHVAILEAARVFGTGMIDITVAALKATPVVIRGFELMANGILTAIDVIVSGAAHAFGWIPGVGDKLKAANKQFDTFKQDFISGLATAGQQAQKFADTAVPKLEQNRLKLNIRNWEQQIAAAKKQLKTVPESKRAELKAKIADLQAKVRQANRDLASVRSKSVTITAFLQYKGRSIAAVSAGRLAEGGLVGYAGGGTVQGFPSGGTVRGPGTSTSDSILARLSRGEFVMRAAAVRRYGVGLFESLNAMQLGTAGSRPDLGVSSMRTAGAAPSVSVTNVINLTNNGAIGSRMELRDWFTRTLDDVARQGRLPAVLRNR